MSQTLRINILYKLCM